MTKRLKILLATTLSAILITLLLYNINLNRMFNLLTDINIYYLTLGFLSYTLMNLFRVFRYQIITNNELPLPKMTSIVLIHNFYNNLLPARIGEASFPLLLREEQYNFPHSISFLVTSRLFDLIAILPLFLVSLLFLEHTPPTILIIRNLLLLTLTLGAVGLLAMTTFSNQLTAYLSHHPPLDKLANYLDTQANQLKTLSTIQIASITSSSILIWILSFFMYILLIEGVQINIPWPNIIVASVFVIFSTILPIQGVLQLGTAEAAWAVPLLILGTSKEAAIYTGFITHFARILFFVILGLVGWLIYKFQ